MSPIDSTRDLLSQFIKLEQLLHRYRHVGMAPRGPAADPLRGQGRVLSLLKLTPEISQKELGDILDIRPQSLGELLAKLERSGYIIRTPSEADRRTMIIRLTEAGMSAVPDPEKLPEPDDIFDCLQPEEQEALEGYLARLIERLEAILAYSPTFAWGPGGEDPRRRAPRPPQGGPYAWAEHPFFSGEGRPRRPKGPRPSDGRPDVGPDFFFDADAPGPEEE